MQCQTVSTTNLVVYVREVQDECGDTISVSYLNVRLMISFCLFKLLFNTVWSSARQFDSGWLSLSFRQKLLSRSSACCTRSIGSRSRASVSFLDRIFSFCSSAKMLSPEHLITGFSPSKIRIAGAESTEWVCANHPAPSASTLQNRISLKISDSLFKWFSCVLSDLFSLRGKFERSLAYN